MADDRRPAAESRQHVQAYRTRGRRATASGTNSRRIHRRCGGATCVDWQRQDIVLDAPLAKPERLVWTDRLATRWIRGVRRGAGLCVAGLCETILALTMLPSQPSPDTNAVFDFPQWSVPVAQQLGLLRISIVLAVLSLLYALWFARRERDPYPL